MRFLEMIKISDLKDELSKYQTIFQSLEKKLHESIRTHSDPLIKSVKHDFKRYFESLGFIVSESETEITATYKTSKIHMQKLEPGRRKDDIPCFFRYHLIINSDVDDIYEIYVQESILQEPLKCTIPVFQNLLSLKKQFEHVLHDIEQLQRNIVYSPHEIILKQLKETSLNFKNSLLIKMAQLASLQQKKIRFKLLKHSTSGKKNFQQTFDTFIEVLQALDNPAKLQLKKNKSQ